MGWDPIPAAVLYRMQDNAKLEPILKTQQAIDMMDWGCLEGNWWFFRPFDACLVERETEQFIKKISKSENIPLLYYYNIDDYLGCEELESGKEYTCDVEGWGYRLYSQGEIVANCTFDNRIPTWGEEFARHVHDVAAETNVNSFQLLGLDQGVISRLVELLNPDAILQRMDTDELSDVATEFQTILGIGSIFRH